MASSSSSSNSYAQAVFSSFRTVTQQAVSPLVYPSPLTSYWNKSERAEFKKTLKSCFGGKSVSLQTSEGHTIDGMIFRGGQKKAIIYCVGWQSYFEYQQRFDLIYAITKRVGDIHLMLFNPRGVGESGGGTPSSKGAALDLCHTFKYLTEEEGIDPSDIVIYGHSLGACYGAAGAKLIQDTYPQAKINLFSERSFASYEETTRALAVDYLPNYPNVARAVGGTMAGAIKLCDWGSPADKSISSLKGKICIVYNKYDEAIPFSASFYKKSKNRMIAGQHSKQPVRCIKLLEPELFKPEVAVSSNDDHSPHTRNLTLWEQYEIANELKKMLGLKSEDPINIRRVKELGVQRPELQGATKDFYAALHTVNRLYTYLEKAGENDEGEAILTMFSCLETEHLLLNHFQGQEAVLSRMGKDPLLINEGPQGKKTFYLNVLARARAMLILEQLEKNFKKRQKVQKVDLQLMQMLEKGMPISFGHPALNPLENPAQCLYAETHKTCKPHRNKGVALPASESLESARLSFRGENYFPHSMRLKVLQNLQRQLKKG